MPADGISLPPKKDWRPRSDAGIAGGEGSWFPIYMSALDRLRRVERIMLLFDQVISELR
jgi:hypothetical protein